VVMMGAVLLGVLAYLRTRDRSLTRAG